jgi:hypothetical protein
VRSEAPAPSSFNFNRDIARPAPAVPMQRPAYTQRPAYEQRPASAQRFGSQTLGGQNRAAGNSRRPSFGGNTSGGPYSGRFTGHRVGNPRDHGGDWGWNHGRHWQGAGLYWGGGFWGPFALADLGADALYGSIEDDQDQTDYPSYQVEPDTPGEQLLSDYGLQQIQCGQPNLVEIWGPDNSVICALPTPDLPPNNYEVDPATLTLTPTS